MDNQQAKVDDLIWLCGFFDGEGYLGFNRNTRRNCRKVYHYWYPRASFSNTYEPVLEQIIEILKSNNLAFNVSKKNRQKTNIKWKDNWSIVIQGYKRCKRFLDIVTPYLKIKQEQAKLILKWIDSRENHPDFMKGNFGKFNTVSYTEEEVHLINKVRLYNH